MMGNLSTPDLDTGWVNWFEDYPHPNDFFEPLLAGESIQPTNNTNWPEIDDPALNRKIAELGAEPLGPEQEADYAALDRDYMEQAPWAPYGNLCRRHLRLRRRSTSTRSSSTRPSART